MKDNLEIEHLEKSKFLVTTNSLKSNPIKLFFQCATYIFSKKINNFSYIPKEASLVSNLTLKENLFLDTFQFNQIDNSSISEFSKNLKCNNLKTLLNSVTDWDKLPQSVDYQTLKIVAILKAFLQKSPYLFIENPEANLNQNLQNILKSLIANSSKCIFLTSSQNDQWKELFDFNVTKSDKSFTLEKVESSNDTIKIAS